MPDGDFTVSKIEVDRDLCIGAASCVAIAPDAFELDTENKAVVKGTWNEHDAQSLLDAAKACPVMAIKIYDQSGKQIYPES
ncbi:MAG: ferredoxin [Candidatus Kerfeldbacteria bacterium]|nr:ferredoxin [Candidatus Kerfeldbacteria bacterium]